MAVDSGSVPVPHIIHLQGFFFFFSLFFLLFRTSPAAYSSSQARGWISAAAASLHHSHSNGWFVVHRDLHCNSGQHQIFNPLSKARDRTHSLMDTSQVLNPLSHRGTPLLVWLSWVPFWEEPIFSSRRPILREVLDSVWSSSSKSNHKYWGKKEWKNKETPLKVFSLYEVLNQQ